ncbi:hypothetical protein PV08_10515 [Exophiala spinifera]|uniref:Zn(2)-C6 fungal-type domain-containing protein n=1 Tax=Exophiala spinifera TaxID=91928 RepID=A0A0D2AXM9_9EURO|nr:uncharacterized protein PV08_10515 [Exophiala spinifera]KIW11215.1 hypothetical protein PV08_10515 [Exophiala spinifera]
MSLLKKEAHTEWKLPACERCRLRKVKCDTLPPKCTSCRRGDAACIIVDPDSRERYTRDGLYQLEQKLQLLEQTTAHLASNPQVASPASPSATKGTRTQYVGDGSGLHFFNELSSHTTAGLPLTEEAPYLQHKWPDYATIAPHSLPTSDIAQLLVDHWISHVYLLHPFLAEKEVLDTFRRVYNATQNHATPDDLYRLHMIFAISSVTTFRRGQTQEHPYGYFRAAQHYFGQVSMTGSMQGIQNVLLIARFAMYYHVDCSIWDLSRFCIRQCIALELHRPPAHVLSPFEEQLRRNVFWDCYIHDRYSSGILGRPYAIAEDDITVELPVERTEADLANGSTLEDSTSHGRPDPPNKASVFCFLIKLRRLFTRISTCFYTTYGHTESQRRSLAHAARVRTDLDCFMRDLDRLRSEAPVFDDLKSLYERPQWYDFIIEKDRLTLLRGAITHMPVDRLQPPRKLLLTAMECATRVLGLYNAMFSSGHITWTRSYFQIMFTSGLTIMYTMSALREEKKRLQKDVVNPFSQATHALITTAELMKVFVTEMPDASRFATVFEMLVKHYTGTGTRARPSRGVSPLQHGVLVPGASRPSGNHDTDSEVAISRPLSSQEVRVEEMPNNDIPPLGGGPADFSQGGGYDFGNEFDLDGLPDWSLHPGTDNILGQVEASLGEYAWGMAPDDSVWSQWDVFQNMP